MTASGGPQPDRALTASTLWAWQALARPRRLPDPLYLAGDSALSMHLEHRDGEDLRFLYHEHAVDLPELARGLPLHVPFTVVTLTSGALLGTLHGTTVEFLHADESAPQTLLEKTTRVAGLNVAGLEDLAALKLRTVLGGGALRDYYDLIAIDEDGGFRLKAVIDLFLERYRLRRTRETLLSLAQALADLPDTACEQTLPMRRRNLARLWADRHADLVRQLNQPSSRSSGDPGLRDV